jgi:hypothetical protein
MALKDLFSMIFGNQDQFHQLSNMTPEQQQGLQGLYNNPLQSSPLYGAGANYLQNLLSGNPDAYKAFEAPLMQQFNQQTVPGLAERFAGMGTGAGAGNSSAFYNSLGQAGKDLTANIGALRGNLQMQGLGQGLQYAQQPYQNTLNASQIRPWENAYQPGSTGLLGQVLGGVGSGLGMGAGNAFGGGLMKAFGF